MNKNMIISGVLLLALSGVNLASAQAEPDKIILSDEDLLELYRMSSVASRLPTYRLYMDLYADKLSIPNRTPGGFDLLLEMLREDARRLRK